MQATLTSKGQITLPKEIRERLGLDAGSMLDFQILEDNTITARQVKPDARRIRGLLKSPHAIPLRTGVKMGPATMVDTMLYDALVDPFHNIAQRTGCKGLA